MVLYKGSSSIQRSNFGVILDEADDIVMKEDEDPRDLYRRVTALAVALKDHRSKDLDDFANWVFSIKSHLNHGSTNLWRIIDQGYYLHDQSNLTPREEADNQYNHSSLFIFQSVVLPEDLPHLRPFTLAKDCWEHIMVLYKGSSSIQRSNYEVKIGRASCRERV